MLAKTTSHFTTILLGAFLVGACGTADEAPPADGMPMDGMPGMPGMPMGEMEGMRMDPGMMERHADEAEEMAAELDRHLGEFRALPAEAQHARMGEHAGHVSRMLGLMDRQMREMGMRMPMTEDQMGTMMGMSGEEHRRMVEEMRTLRGEMERLQIGSMEEVRAGMPAHLERLEAMVGMMERSGQHMRPR